jgi:hypothetical protein
MRDVMREVTIPSMETANLASDVVNLARDVTIPEMETTSLASDAADLATEATNAARKNPNVGECPSATAGQRKKSQV